MPLKLLDYGKPRPFGKTIGPPRKLAWPVNAFRVTLPKVPARGEGLNPFERVILNIIDAGGSREAELLAREACIPVDLVRCVLLRLRDKAYIDEDNQIIKLHRDKWNGKVHHLDFVTALLFRELAAGTILPYLHLLGDGNPLKQKEEEERFFRRIRWAQVHKSPPTCRDVISAMQGMRKRSQAFGDEATLPPVQLITIAVEPEQYYLDCPIAIQQSDGEFRIADPFGNGCSLVLEHAFSRLLEDDSGLSDWLMTWKRSLFNRGPDKQATASQEPYDNDANWGRYPKLVANLRLGRNRQYRSIEQIHASLEWALFYACAQRAYRPAVQQLTLATQAEHPALLQKAAEDISLILPQDGLRPVRAGKLDDFLSGKAEMATVLSIALLMAACDASHPLRRIAAKYQDLISRLFLIKQARDAPAHGVGKVRLKELALPEEAFMREMVTTLLPAIRFSGGPIAEVDQESAADSLLDARTCIQSEFGFALFNRLGTNLQDRLIDAERFWLLSKDGDDAQSFACDIYAALQSAFRRSLSGVLPPDIKDSQYAVTAQKRTSECGLGTLPQCLRTVKRSAIQETLQGNDQTLGSCTLAFLLISDGDTLRAIAHTHPPFISDVAHVIDRRGHGNEPMPLPKDEIRKLRKAAYTIIKTLLEV